MKQFVLLFGLLLACFAFAEGDFDSQFLLTPRDNKSLSDAERRIWIRATCNRGAADFEWRGCNLGQIDGKDYLIDSKNDSFYAAATVITGSFTAPNQREALVTYLYQEIECCRTVDVLLRYQRGQYRPVMMIKDDFGAGCLRFRLRSRRDALGCARQSNSAGGGYGAYSYAGVQSTTLFRNEVSSKMLLDAVGYPPICDENPRADTEAPFGRIDIRAWGKTDANRDGTLDLIMTIGERRWKSSTTAAACKEDPPLKTWRVTLIASDSGLQPTEASRLILKRINAEYRPR